MNNNIARASYNLSVMRKKAIPDRWIPYSPCGKIIEGTRIVCFKTPLKLQVQKNNNIEEIWDLETLIKRIPGLSNVIDLTNTNKYYEPQELEDAGVSHFKLLMPGREIPPKNLVNIFMDKLDEILSSKPDSLVGVHCTHGLNRTGYMVCTYMRDRMGISPAEAIQRFEAARGYKIERKNYIADILGNPPLEPEVGPNVHTDIRKTKRTSPLKTTKSKRVDNWRTENRDKRTSSFSYDYRYDY